MAGGPGSGSRQGDRHGREPLPYLMIAGTVAVLVASFVIQLVVYNRGGRTSLSDLPHLVLLRGIGPGALPYLDRALEYPVGSGLLFYLATLVSPTPLGVLCVTAVAASVTAVVITVALERRVGARAWRWAVGPPLLLYVFQNWDVFAIAAMVFGLLAFERHRDARAGALLGIGAFIKLFPAILVLPLAVLRWAQGDRRGAVRVAGAGAVTFGVLNLPVLIATPSGWWHPISFQGNRQATWGTVWFTVYRFVGAPVIGTQGARFANAVSLGALTLGIVVLTVYAARRKCDPLAIAAVAVTLFVLTNKVYSPTYDFWLVPFFALLPIRRWLWIAFCAFDLAIYLLVFGHFHDMATIEQVRTFLPTLVFCRAGVLVAFMVGALRVTPSGRPAGRADDARDPTDSVPLTTG